MTAVIDTNGVLKSVSKKGTYHWLYEAFEAGQFIWVVSNEVISEYAEMIDYYYSAKAADLVTAILLASPNHLRYEPSFRWGLIADDPDDNKFVDCAIGANVDYLVPDDRHILNLRRRRNLFPPVPVISFAQFKRAVSL